MNIVDFKTALQEAQSIIDEENTKSVLQRASSAELAGVRSDTDVNVLDYEEEEDNLIGVAVESVKIKPAMDSGAVANVVHPAELPDGVEVVPNETDTHFTGAGGGRIKRFGSCVTKPSSEHGDVGCADGSSLTSLVRSTP